MRPGDPAPCYTPRMPTKSQTSVRIVVWLFLSVVASLTPILINAITGRFQSTHRAPLELIAGGELLLISASIAADAIGRAIHAADHLRTLRIIAGAGCGLLLMINSIYFGQLAFAQDQNHERLAEARRSNNLKVITDAYSHQTVYPNVAPDSLWLFGFTVVTGFSVILLERADHGKP